MSLSESVLISGVFDPIHAGHLAYIREADRRGPVVCVLSDAPEKHPPLVPIAERASLLQALGVARVIIGQSVASALFLERPQAYYKGADWRGKLPQEQIEVCARYGIQIVYTDTITQSSSQLLGAYERSRNAAKLAAFEQFVSQQKPADAPWEPVTDYSAAERKKVEAPQANIIASMFAGCDVLDYGCGYGFLMDLLRERGMTVCGWDPALTHSGDNQKRFADVVICREVLEHLTVRELAATVRELAYWAKRYVYVTTRFTPDPHLLDVAGSDHLDPTHISMLNQDLLRTLFVLEGCTRRADLEQKLDWRNLGRVLVYEVPA